MSSFAHTVFAARAQGDAVAEKIFNDGVDYYAEAMEAAYRHMGKPFRGVMGGGIFMNHPEYAAAVRKRAPQGCEIMTGRTLNEALSLFSFYTDFYDRRLRKRFAFMAFL